MDISKQKQKDTTLESDQRGSENPGGASRFHPHQLQRMYHGNWKEKPPNKQKSYENTNLCDFGGQFMIGDLHMQCSIYLCVQVLYTI